MSAVLPRPTTNPVDTSAPLRSGGVVMFAGLSYLFVGWGFSYLDRRFSSFGLEGFLWLVWAVLGFGAGALHARKPTKDGGQIQWTVLALVGGLLAVFPGFIVFNLLRWACLFLMVIMGARAVVMRTRRDFYFTMTTIFVVSFMVGTHGNADWTMWFYLGPAWAFGGLALAWEHAAGTPLSRWTKLFMTLGFMGTSLALAALLFFFLPRPAILGFGFLPPGTNTPGMFTQPAGGGDQPGTSGQGGSKGGTSPGNTSGAPQPGGAQQWRGMLKGMRSSLGDRFIPGWQRGTMEALLDAGGWLLDKIERVPGDGSQAGSPSDKQTGEQQSQTFVLSVAQVIHWLLWILLLIVLLIVGYLLWRRRYRIGLAATLACARLLAPRFPLQSMRVSALSMKWCLYVAGHRRAPGQSVREHWQAAGKVSPLARRWLGYAVDAYCVVRFGGERPTSRRALHMNEAVHGACDIVMDLMPELNRKN